MVLLKARTAEVYITDAIASVNESTTMMTQATGADKISGRIKSLEISGAEKGTETVYFFGADGNGRQNSELDEENMSERELSGTLVFTDNVPASWAAGSATQVGSTGYTRVQGDGTIPAKCIVMRINDSVSGTDLIVSLNNAKATKLGDISLDAEGHAEQEIAFACAARDYREEYKKST